MIFKPLTRAEYERLSLEQRMDYLRRLMIDIQAKADETKQQMTIAQEVLGKRPD